MDHPKKHPADNDAKGAKPKKPKHFHAGPNPVEEEEQKQTAVADAASPINRLYPAVLSVIFDFLALSELHPVLPVSRSWLSTIRSMPFGLRPRYYPISPRWLASVVSSALGRLIGSTSAKLISNEMCTLALGMPRLFSMQCELMPSDARKMILPPKLETLELNLGALDAAGFNTALVAIGQLTALKDLTLRFSSWLPDANFAPLSKCASLEELTVNAPPEVKWSKQPTDAHIDQLRTVTHLRCVAISRLNSSSLAKLLRSPHSLQWTEMPSVGGINSASAAALRNLPGLLTLNTWYCRDVSFLSVMTQLQSLAVAIKTGPWAITADALVEALFSCHQLTFLDILAPVTSAHLTRLLPHLPLFRSLTLHLCSELESLSFLHGALSLRTLELVSCVHPGLRPVELRHVLALQELTKLVLRKSLASPLDDFTQHQLSTMPNLTLFEYTPVPAAAES